jgi:hypothetical protein
MRAISPRAWKVEQWKQISGPSFSWIAHSGAAVLCCDANHEVHSWSLGKWTRADGIKLVNVSIGCDGTVVGCTPGHELMIMAPDGSFRKLSGCFAQVSCCNRVDMIGVTPSDEIWRGDGTTWEQIPGSLCNVSIGEDGEIWGCNRQCNIYRRTGRDWNHIPGALRMISVYNQDCVVGVNAAGGIFSWEGSWQHIPGSLACVSAGTTLWGCNSAGKVFFR